MGSKCLLLFEEGGICTYLESKKKKTFALNLKVALGWSRFVLSTRLLKIVVTIRTESWVVKSRSMDIECATVEISSDIDENRALQEDLEKKRQIIMKQRNMLQWIKERRKYAVRNTLFFFANAIMSHVVKLLEMDWKPSKFIFRSKPAFGYYKLFYKTYCFVFANLIYNYIKRRPNHTMDHLVDILDTASKFESYSVVFAGKALGNGYTHENFLTLISWIYVLALDLKKLRERDYLERAVFIITDTLDVFTKNKQFLNLGGFKGLGCVALSKYRRCIKFPKPQNPE